jgi:uncharacterized membrane protein
MKPGRRGYLDWLRGVAVLIMIGSHTIDSWTIVADRVRAGYRYSMMVGGFGAPIFLFLAGVAIVLAAGSHLRNGQPESTAAAAARRCGWEIFGLAFLFRLQAWALSGGPFLGTLLKVDILNVMGLAMVGAALLRSLGRTNGQRAALCAAAVVALAMLTPIVRATPLLDPLPDRWSGTSGRTRAGRTSPSFRGQGSSLPARHWVHGSIAPELRRTNGG